jgi:phytoene dehydrogenase-like protein
MINTPFDSGNDWDPAVNKMRQTVKKKIKNILGIDLSDNIVFEEVLTPSDIEVRTGSLHGSIYGFSSNSITSAFRRPPIKSPFYKNLFFCGGSVHPGGGIPLVLLSGKHASELIGREYL